MYSPFLLKNMLIREILDNFKVEGEIVNYELINKGRINKTYKVTVLLDGITKYYILQRINTYVFKNPDIVMENIFNTTSFMRKKFTNPIDASKYVLHFKKTLDDKKYYKASNDMLYRLYRFVDNSVSYDSTDDLSIIYEAGKAFGNFQNLLSDFNIDNLYTTIEDFHNTIKRYEALKNATKFDIMNRKDECSSLINEYLSYEDYATSLYKMFLDGIIPMRVTHNDTKFNNVLFDLTTSKHLAVIDLDTIMPGLIQYDYGDGIRSISGEADSDYNQELHISIEKFDAFTKGFLEETKSSLSKKELETLALGAISVTIELGVRFLTDYLEGDKYFVTKTKKENFFRSKSQISLAKDMIKKYDLMQNIIKKYL
ncbi:phosphotransferase [bacterium]|nr:phosphotransferase [bacterium]